MTSRLHHALSMCINSERAWLFRSGIKCVERGERHHSSRNANGGRRWVQRRKPKSETRLDVHYTGEHCTATACYADVMRVSTVRIGTARAAGSACCIRGRWLHSALACSLDAFRLPCEGQSRSLKGLEAAQIGSEQAII